MTGQRVKVPRDSQIQKWTELSYLREMLALLSLPLDVPPVPQSQHGLTPMSAFLPSWSRFFSQPVPKSSPPYLSSLSLFPPSYSHCHHHVPPLTWYTRVPSVSLSPLLSLQTMLHTLTYSSMAPHCSSVKFQTPCYSLQGPVCSGACLLLQPYLFCFV